LWVTIVHCHREAIWSQGWQIGFFDVKFYKFGFFSGEVGVKKNCLPFSFQYLAFFGGSWHIPSDWRFGFLNILLKSVIRLF